MKENKPKDIKCECCSYSSFNHCEFKSFYNEEEYFDSVCLDCLNDKVGDSLSDVHMKMVDHIKSRKQEALKNTGKLIYLSQPKSSKATSKRNEILYPKDVVSLLNKRIIGQKQAKNKISIAISNHIQKINNPDLNIDKSNILLIGPTGTGKTEFFRTIAKELSIPFVSCSATNLTAAGYVGQDVPQILAPLVSSLDDVYLAEKGIVFIDEIDKLANNSDDSVINTIRVQQELLKLIEGDIVQVNIGESKNHPNYIDLDTKNILFICAGAFSGLKNQFTNDERVMGLNSNQLEVPKLGKDWTKEVSTDHLSAYGLIPEFLGRLPVLAYTEELTEDELSLILTNTEQCLVGQYTKLFSTYNISTTFSKEFISEVAKEAFDQKLGARGLKKIFENKISDFMFEIHNYYGQEVVFCNNSKIIKIPALRRVNE